MPPAAISTPRFALIRWVSPPDSTSAPTTPAVFHDQGGEDGFGTKFCVTGALDCGQQSADQCAPTDHRAGSMILTGAVLVEFRTHLADEVTDVGGIEIERVDGAPRVHPAFGLVVVGERTELEFDVRVLLE